MTHSSQHTAHCNGCPRTAGRIGPVACALLRAAIFVWVSLLVVSGSAQAVISIPELQSARDFEQAGQYRQALIHYQQYLKNNPGFERHNAITIRLSVLNELVSRGDDPAASLFLEALSAHESGDDATATWLLGTIDQDYASSYLHDDALYFTAYIALLEKVDFENAHQVLRRLQALYPESRYADTALYSEGIALEQLGNTQGARAAFTALKERHTGLSIPWTGHGFSKGNMLSRYWFERTEKRLAILDERANNAARLLSRQSLKLTPNHHTQGRLKVKVLVEGTVMTLLLEPSTALGPSVIHGGDESTLVMDDEYFFSGQVQGEPDSWVRVSINGDAISGVISVPFKRYQLTTDSLVGDIDYYRPHQQAALSGTDDPTLLHDDPMYPPPYGVDTPRGLSASQLGRNPVTRIARMAVVVDSQYDDYYGGRGLSQALSALNVADGIYRENFGLALSVDSAVVFDSRDNDPMNLGGVPLETMLRRFRDYRLEEKDNLPDVGLVYLFSGNQNSDEAIGLAWIGAACRSDGYDVGVTTPYPHNDLLVTHELGHSLGAMHDSETSCASETDQLMWPRISGQTQQSFTNCSRDAVEISLPVNCFEDSIDLDLQLSSDTAGGVVATITNNDASRAVDNATLSLEQLSVTFEALPQQCFDAGNTELVCRTGEILPQSSVTLRFAVADNDTADAQIIMAELTPVGATDVLPQNNYMRLNVQSGNATTVADSSNDSPLVVASSDVANADDRSLESISATTNFASEGATPQSSAAGGALGKELWLVLLVLWRCRIRQLYRAFAMMPVLSSFAFALAASASRK